MLDQDDTEYFAARAKVERGMSDTASEPIVALIHSQLADRYERLSHGLTPSFPTLRIVGA